MQSRKRMLLSTTVVPLIVFVGFAVGGAILVAGPSARPALAQCAAKKKINPCAAAKSNPCAAACNPCAAAKCNPCAAACNPCNPCAAAKSNPCNPCAAACSPCGAGKKCVVPRLQAAAACNPCNPCAAAKCNPCNPCAAAKCNPCNPCAAAKCNPCNPCAAGAAELTDAEAVAAYDCLLNDLKAAYAKSGNDIAVSYADWPRFSTQAYQSGTHGGRYVQNYANAKARAYGAYENAGQMPLGAVLAKDSFGVKAGRVSPGPLFLMEKMHAGFNAGTGNWRYTMIMPNGAVFGTTGGAGGAKMQFCADCHLSVAPEVDSMLFIPDEYRIE